MTSLFDEGTLRKLEQLSLVAHRVRAGVMKGERRSTKHGTSIEFADYRDYTRGDDLRRIDWNVYARLERPFIKLLEEEEDLTVHILLDASGSMDWPEDDQAGPLDAHKFRYALRLAAGLGHVALTTGDRLTAGLLADGSLVARWGPHRTRGQTLRLLTWLEGQSTRGTTDLNAALRDVALRGGQAGLALLLTDMFSPQGYEDGLTALQSRGYEVAIVHILSPGEISPELAGDLRLLDAETGVGQDVTVDAAMRDLYARRLLQWREELASTALKRGVHYISVDTGTPWENVILYALRRAGVVR